ncbi:hypothetical protein AM202_00005, partial [Actinobacillus minor 202]
RLAKEEAERLAKEEAERLAAEEKARQEKLKSNLSKPLKHLKLIVQKVFHQILIDKDLII